MVRECATGDTRTWRAITTTVERFMGTERLPGEPFSVVSGQATVVLHDGGTLFPVLQERADALLVEP